MGLAMTLSFFNKGCRILFGPTLTELLRYKTFLSLYSMPASNPQVLRRYESLHLYLEFISFDINGPR
jgi:hypothetical protein